MPFTPDTDIKSLQKEAFIKKLLPRLKPFLGKLGPKGLRRVGGNVERAVGRGVGHVLGPQGQATSNKLLKGTAGEIASQAVGGAGVLGLIQGGLEAATADPGQRGQAFLSGLGSGAASGAMYGGLSGLVGKPIRNLRQSALTQAVKRRGLKPNLASKSMDQGFFKNLKTIGTGKSKVPGINRELAGINAAGQVGQLGAEWVVPTMIMNRMMEDEVDSEPTPVKQADDQSFLSTIPPSLAGAALGGVGAGLGTDYLNTRNYLPTGARGKLLNRIIPATGSVLGAYTAMRLAKPPPPPPPPVAEDVSESLSNVDFDKLLRYYKKREDSPALQP